MNHVTNIAIVFFVFLFTYTYADLISINSLQIHETNLLKITLIVAFAVSFTIISVAFNLPPLPILMIFERMTSP